MSIARIAVELDWFFFPLSRAVQSGETLSEFLAEFGYDLSPANAANALNDVVNLDNAVTTLGTLIDALVTAAAGDPTNITEAEVAQIVAAGREVYTGIDGIVTVVTALAGAPPGPDFPAEVFDRLIDHYLGDRLPPVRELASSLAVRVARPVLAGTPGARAIDYTAVRYDFARLGQFLSETGRWADEVYGWGRDFGHAKAISAIANVVESFGGRVRLEPVDQAVAAAFLANIPVRSLPAAVGAPGSELIFKAKLPVFSKTELDGLGDLGATVEAGLTVLPVGDFAQPAGMGLALAPFVDGTVALNEALSNSLSFRFEATAGATGGRSIAVQPSGISTRGSGAANASFEATLTYAAPDGAPTLLIGQAGATRIEATRIFASVGGSMDGDFFVAAGLGRLSAVIDMGEDGLLSAVVPAPVTITAGDVLIGIRPGRGVYFEGGTSLALDIPLDIDLEFLRIMGLGLKLDWSQLLAIDVTLEGELAIGPLYAYADGIGLRSTLVERQGLLGKYDLNFSFIKPTTYAVALDISPIEGGGLISLKDPEYRGALALRFENIGFSAFAILNTRLPGGRPGFSFAASIFGEFNLPLGYGFFLTGLGGVIGINRTLDTDAMRAVLYEGRFDNLLFPADPIANAATILDDMASILPAREGQHVFGPVARIGWGVPTLISVKLGVVIEVGQDLRILILGTLECDLPTRDAAIISLRLAFFGEIDFSAGTISFDATLQNSRLLAFALSGDAALRTGWAPRIEQVASFGGLHPLFPRPANLPDLRRVTIAFGTNNPRVTLTAYAAVTLNSLQFGAEARLYAKGPDLFLIGQLAAEGWAYFNALITFDPFAFQANLGGGLQLLRNGSVVCGLGFDLTLSGPNVFTIDGQVWVTVFGQDISFPIRHSWGSRASLPPVTADAVAVLRDALTRAKIEPVARAARSTALTFRTLAAGEETPFDPDGGAKVTQQAVPLGITIDKLGEALVVGTRLLDLRLTRAGLSVAGSTLVQDDFVHGHFFYTTEAEKLRATAYDRLKAGATLEAAGIDTAAAQAVTAAYDYEVVPIPVTDNRAAGFAVGAGLFRQDALLLDRVLTATRREKMNEVVRLDANFPIIDRVLAANPQFTTRAVLDAAIRAGDLTPGGGGLPAGGLHGSFASARFAVGVEAKAILAETADPRRLPDLPGARGGVLPSYLALAAR